MLPQHVKGTDMDLYIQNGVKDNTLENETTQMRNLDHRTAREMQAAQVCDSATA